MSKDKTSKKLDLSDLANFPQSDTPKPSEASAQPAESSVTPKERPTARPTESSTYAEGHKPFRRPQRLQYKPPTTLENATNAAGELFQLGDQVSVKAPWGEKAVARIDTIYQDESGTVWAHYLPIDSIPENWSWLGGCTRANLLVKA
jgi:hypothetical protein